MRSRVAAEQQLRALVGSVCRGLLVAGRGRETVDFGQDIECLMQLANASSEQRLAINQGGVDQPRSIGA
jgi:hypothetical protein